MPNDKQDLKELTEIICIDANSLLPLNFSKFKKCKISVQIEIQGKKKNLCLECSKRVTSEGGTSAVGYFFFHIHKFKLKNGQQFTPVFL